jgi:hypothetical protein
MTVLVLTYFLDLEFAKLRQRTCGFSRWDASPCWKIVWNRGFLSAVSLEKWALKER